MLPHAYVLMTHITALEPSILLVCKKRALCRDLELMLRFVCYQLWRRPQPHLGRRVACLLAPSAHSTHSTHALDRSVSDLKNACLCNSCCAVCSRFDGYKRCFNLTIKSLKLKKSWLLCYPYSTLFQIDGVNMSCLKNIRWKSLFLRHSEVYRHKRRERSYRSNSEVFDFLGVPSQEERNNLDDSA